jgi:hypothetical protein
VESGEFGTTGGGGTILGGGGAILGGGAIGILLTLSIKKERPKPLNYPMSCDYAVM